MAKLKYFLILFITLLILFLLYKYQLNIYTLFEEKDTIINSIPQNNEIKSNLYKKQQKVLDVKVVDNKIEKNSFENIVETVIIGSAITVITLNVLDFVIQLILYGEYK